MIKLGLDKLKILKHVSNFDYQEELCQAMMSKQKCIIWVYVLGAENLVSKDSGKGLEQASDPYLKIKINGEQVDERANHLTDETNPEFNKMYEFSSNFPGCSPLTIQVWDFDAHFGDDFIGETVIDLEDRFFSTEW